MIVRSNECRRCREAITLMVGGVLAEPMSNGMKAHLEHCADCQRHAEEVRALGENLRRLAAASVEPSPGFEHRWRAAIHNTAPRATVVEWAREVVSRNRRPLLALAPVWAMILLFRFAAPEVAPSEDVSVRSPVEIVRALRSTSFGTPFAEVRAVEHDRPILPRPRSDAAPADPTTNFRWVNGRRREPAVA